MIRRRHVFYIEGYDPQGIPGYYRLFRRELARFRALWPVRTTLSAPETDDDGIAGRWRIETAGPNWQVSTTYEFLRWDDLIARDMARPMWILGPRAVWVFVEYLLNGTIARVFRANWRFGLFYLFPTAGLLLTLLVPLLLGWAAGRFGAEAGLSSPAAAVFAALVAAAAYVGARRLADRWFVVQMTASWQWFRDWAHGERPDYEARVDAFARRIVAEARAADVDEILVIGHSGGGTTAIPVIARALAIDPDFARAGAPVTVAALGTSLPLAALHPRADHIRAAIHRVAIEPSLVWVDGQARKDVINFDNFDPVGGVGIDAGPRRCNPLIWNVRFRDVVSPEFYARLRWDFFRMHFQFIMANDRRAPYDYFMFVCGPLPFLDWARRREAALAAFADDARLVTAAIDDHMPA